MVSKDHSLYKDANKRTLDFCQHVQKVRTKHGIKRKHNGRDFLRMSFIDGLKEFEQVGEIIVNTKCHTSNLMVKVASPLREANRDGFMTYQVRVFIYLFISLNNFNNNH